MGRNGVLFRELKSQRGRLTTDQSIWLARLKQAGEDAAVWRPLDWPRRIKAELLAIK